MLTTPRVLQAESFKFSPCLWAVFLTVFLYVTIAIPHPVEGIWRVPTMVFPITDPDLLLPTSEELPCSDDTPVDNENQNTLPNWLLAVLEGIWGDRQDWFFAVDMGIYDREAQKRRTPLVIPDGFLSLGVTRHKRNGFGRLSYVLREENEIPPILVLEMVSRTYGKEYGEKLGKYETLGVKYYVLYNPEYYNPEYYRRDGHHPFEVYAMGPDGYELQTGEPYWMPEIGLGIGRVNGRLGGIEREWLAWFDSEGKPYPLPQQRAAQAEQNLRMERQRTDYERQRADQERQRAEQLAHLLQQERLGRSRLLEKLKQLGLDMEDFAD